MGQIVPEEFRDEFGAGAVVYDTIRLALDPSRLYFFSPETGESLLRHAA